MKQFLLENIFRVPQNNPAIVYWENLYNAKI